MTHLNARIELATKNELLKAHNELEEELNHQIYKNASNPLLFELR